MNQALIFNIQKFSIHDGPGIRTTVFFKGCPLRCKWCANPESQSTKIEYSTDQNGNKKQEGEYKTIEEIVDVVMQDIDFYEESGGGVTLSGGEVLMHPDFAGLLLQVFKEMGLHTAIETTGFASREAFAQVIAHADLLLFDMKHWDSKKHKEGTGVTNQLITANMAYAISIGKEVLPRIPVIPGFNDALEDAVHFAKLLQSIGAKKAQLLPFHQFGENKYEMLGRAYAYKDVTALHPEDLEAYRQAFCDHGVQAFF